MAVGAGSIKRASKLNAEAAEQKMQTGKDMEEAVKKEEVVTENITSDNAVPKKKTTKKTSAKKTTAKVDSTEKPAKKTSVKKTAEAKVSEEKESEEEKSGANTVVVEETPQVVKNKACQLRQNLPIHLL